MSENNQPDIQGIISALSANPEMLSAAMKLFSGMPGGNGYEKSEHNEQKTPDISALLGMLPAMTGKGHPKPPKPDCDDGCDCPPHKKPPGVFGCAPLLVALKPYLSHERRDAVDYLMKFSQLGTFFGNQSAKKGD